jgi:hypothetical protein
MTQDENSSTKREQSFNPKPKDVSLNSKKRDK